MSKLYHKGNKKGFPFCCCSAVLVNVQQLPTTAPDQTPPKSLVSGAPLGARPQEVVLVSVTISRRCSIFCSCMSMSYRARWRWENRSKKGDMYIMTCLWNVWCFWHVLKCRFLALALLSYPKIVEEFCGFRWQHKASRCPFLVVDHPCIQATLRLWSVSSVLWDGTPCMWSTARSQSAGEVRINHPKLC